MFTEFRNLYNIGAVTSSLKPISHRVVVDSNPEMTSLKAALRQVDPSNGLPVDVLDRYLSDKTPPEVRDFIQRTIFKQYGTDEISTRDLSDDDIARALPNGRESIHAYERRIIEMLEQDEAYEEYKRKQKSKEDVSS